MAKKNKPSGKRPAMFYQQGNIWNQNISDGPRIRIVHPDGRVEWCTLAKTVSGSFNFLSGPCYMIRNYPENFKEALKLIRAYDKEAGFPKMIFMGEL